MLSVIHSDVLPFEYEKSKMWVEIALSNINSEKEDYTSINFVFDTGAPGILLSREDFEDLGYGKLKPLKDTIIRGPSMKPVDARFYKIPDFKIVGTFCVHNPIVKVPNKANKCRNLLGHRAINKRNFCVCYKDNWIYFERTDRMCLSNLTC